MFFAVPCWGSVLPPRPLLRVWGCLGYPALLSAGWGFVPRSVARLAPCSRWRPLTGWSSLKLWVLGGSWFSPLCSPGHRSASRSTCSALPPVSRLLFRTKDLPSFINNRLSSRSSECTAARFKYPANRPGGGGRYSLPLRAVSSPRHSPLSSQPEWTCVA